MSRQNRVNPDHYKTAGRLTADDLAREQQKQRRRVKPGPRAGGGAPTPRTSRAGRKR
jgi:hypothetical protein